MDDAQFIEEENLKDGEFNCCGDEDLYPFKCLDCGHIMVFCYECDAVYLDLNDTKRWTREMNHFDRDSISFQCPRCGYGFEYHFVKNDSYKVSSLEWQDAGHEALLKNNAGNDE